MFNLIVKSAGWADGRDTIDKARTFEYTKGYVEDQYSPGGELDTTALMRLPTIFMQETFGERERAANVGTITSVRVAESEIALEYVYDPIVAPIPNARLEEMATELDIARFEFSRTHWAVKDVDLFKVLMRNMQPRRQQPRVFRISDPERIEPSLVSAMMPFHPRFDGVYAKLREVAEGLDLRCRRADDIWENPEVIQDVVSLIDHSQVVICDCSGRNANVFYEIGIAHSLGREVILITQNAGDIPFDLRHLRYVEYLNNGEGLIELGVAVSGRLEVLMQDLIE